jgi:hypothetical protein
MNSSVVLVANNRYRSGESKAANVSFSAFGVEIS